MRSIIYISGIMGGLFLLICLLGTIHDFKYNDVLLLSGLSLIILVFIPLSIINKYKQSKKIDGIIKSYADKSCKHKSIPCVKPELKTWSKHKPFIRERKSGLNWGGGNIKGANASRSKRKVFLK